MHIFAAVSCTTEEENWLPLHFYNEKNPYALETIRESGQQVELMGAVEELSMADPYKELREASIDI